MADANETTRITRTGIQAGIGTTVTTIVAALLAWALDQGIEIPAAISDSVTNEILVPGAIALTGLIVAAVTAATTAIIEKLSRKYPILAKLNGPNTAPTYDYPAP